MTTSTNAYWLMGIENFITTERIDPIVNPGRVSGHVHSVVGGSNFRFNTTTESLRQSECSSIPIPEDKSAYWFPHLYFQWANGSFTSLNGGAVIYYLFSDAPGTTTAFPDDFRMLSGDPTLRTYDPNSHAQQAISYLCLDFNGVSTRHESLPTQSCPSGIRAQINFPSCWDGKNLDSPDHKSHVAFLSGGPDSGTCSDPKYPVTLPRIFIEVYWGTNEFDNVRSQAMDPSQPFVFSYGDPTGYGYHADFINGWDKGVLQNAVDKCHCNPYGDATCCVDQGIFHMDHGKNCRITKAIDEITTGTIPKLPGNNPVQPEGQRAVLYTDSSTPNLIYPVFAYTGNTPTQTGAIIPGTSVPKPTTAPPSEVVSTKSATSAPSSSAASAQSSSSHIQGSSAPSSNVSKPSPISGASSSVLSSVPPSPPSSSAVHTSANSPTATQYPHTVPETTSKALAASSVSVSSVPTPPVSSVSTPPPPKSNPENAGGIGYGHSGYNTPNHGLETSHHTGAHVPSSGSGSSSGGTGKCRPRSRGPSRYRRTDDAEEQFEADVNSSQHDTQHVRARNIPIAHVHRRYLNSHF
jgi:hypothetical protein